MLLPDSLYGLTTPTDLGDPSGEYFRSREIGASANNSQVTLAITTVPAGRLLILQSGFIQAVAGAAQVVRTMRFLGVDPAGAVAYTLLEKEANPVGGSRDSLQLPSTIILPPNHSLQVQGVFDAGVNANSIAGAVTGWLVPAGGFRR